jgi:hypothetical protein
MGKNDPEWEPVFGTPQAVANPGGMLQPDTDQPTGNERLDELPDFENDELRGASQEGGEILSEGGTARETGEASGTNRPSGDDMEQGTPAETLIPLPIVGEEGRDRNMG